MPENDSSNSTDLVPHVPVLNAEDLSGMKIQNSEQPINKLPPELLSRIFVVGDEKERGRRSDNLSYYGFQDLAVQVCSHWRDVAINYPALWTYIYISHPPPHLHASLYLDRAGPAAPLEIDLEMRTQYIDGDQYDWKSQLVKADETFGYLISHGASISRWKSLIVCAKVPEVLFKTIGFLNTEPAPALQFLALRWKTLMDFEAERQTLECLAYPQLFDESHTLSNTRQPRLRSVDFDSLPVGFMFNRPLPLLTGLTHLKLTEDCNRYPLPKLHALFSSNLQLESLRLHIRSSQESDPEPTALRVQLPSLRSFSLISSAGSSRPLAILQMIGAPGITHLQLSVQLDHITFPKLVNYVTTGKLEGEPPGASQTPGDDHASPHKPIYPILQDLDIRTFSDQSVTLLREMLATLTTVTRISLSEPEVDLLGNAPWLLPNLESLRISSWLPPELGNILRRRTDGGFPIKILEVDEGRLDEIQGELPESIKVVERPRPALGHLDSDEEYELDDDDYDYNDYDDDDDYSDYDDYGGYDDDPNIEYNFGTTNEFEYNFGVDRDSDSFSGGSF